MASNIVDEVEYKLDAVPAFSIASEKIDKASRSSIFGQSITSLNVLPIQTLPT